MSDVVTRLNAALEGRYAIERELGEGGMATVYLAEDLKHNRNVALKVLKPELAAVVGAERFLAEIKTTAKLQHPNILPLFDSDEANGLVYYVMPFVEGESLRDKLDREKQLGVNESVAITQKVADALDYAHEHGVVHRDIKPGNILLSERGEPLIADFGIALAVAQAGAGRITETGLSLGTPHYMSPEQATGDRDVDPRSDVYALGCVLYEMLAGQPPFSASSAQAVLVKILTVDAPSITSERRTVPPNVGAALAKSLEKLPADRFSSAAEFGAALGDPSFTYEARARTSTTTAPSEPIASVVTAIPWHRDVRSVAALFVGATMTALAAWGWLQPGPLPDHATRLPIDLGDIALLTGDEIIVSPDGSRFALAGIVEGLTALYWRDAAEENFRLIPETTGAQEPSFSPDGDWIVYVNFLQGALLKVSLSGGAPTPVVVSGTLDPRSPHWGDDGTIVFTGPTGMYLVPETGGEPEPLLGPNPNFRNPSLLPGGRFVLGARFGGGIVLLDLETDSIRELIPGGLDPKYVETGHLLYADPSGGLWAVAFDAGRGEVLGVGGAVPVLDGLSVLGPNARFSVSRNGTLVYGEGNPGAGRRLLVVYLDGREEVLGLAPSNIVKVKWSRDGQSVVYQSTDEGDQDSDIYTYDTELERLPRPLTFEGENRDPVFSPDGTQVAFASRREGTDGLDLFVKTLDDDVAARPIITLAGDQIPTQWPSDTLIVFESGNPSDLWMLNLSDPDNPVAAEYLPSEANLGGIMVSPDGDLAAYVSNESGPYEVYIRSFPDPGEQTPVSQGGGWYPLWSPDGNTVYYSAPPASGGVTFWAARIQRDPTPVVFRRDPLFTGNYNRGASDLHPDGDRLVIQQFSASSGQSAGDVAEPERFLVVVNWFEELLEKMGN